MLSIAHENDRTQGLMAVAALRLVFPMVTIQTARFAGQVDFANVALFVGYSFMLVAFALGSLSCVDPGANSCAETVYCRLGQV